MRVLTVTCALLVAGVVSVAAQEPAAARLPSVELPADLDRVLRDYESGWAIGGEALAPLFAEDGFVLARGRPPIRGREAIEEYYGGPSGPLALRAIAFDVNGDVGFIIGGYAQRPGDPDAGKFTLTLKKAANGRWLIYSDMDNSN